MSPEVVAMGEAMLRLWVPVGERVETAPRLEIGIAGAEANVAVALARMGRSAAWLSRLPDNPLGRRVARALVSHGVDTSGVAWVEGGRMGTYYVELSVPPRPATVVYDRAGSTAASMTAADVDWAMVEAARIAFVSGITPALSPSCRDLTAEYMTRARAAGAFVAFDVNYRSRLWDVSTAEPVLTDLCRMADLVIVTEEDAREVFSLSGSVAEVMDAMAALCGTERVVITRGAAGAAWRDGGAAGEVRGYEAVVVDPIGAGDAFAAGVLIGVLEDDLPAGVEMGAAMGALQVGLFGDPLTVDPSEVDALRRGPSRDVTR